MAEVKTRIVFEGKTIGVEDAVKKVRELRDEVAHLGWAVTQTFDPKEITQIRNEIDGLNKQFTQLASQLGSNLPASLRTSYLSYHRQAEATAELYSKNISLVQAQSQVAHAIMSTNFVIRDAPYFFKDFSLGVLAVGNNLNPMIDALLRAKAASKEANVSMLTLLRSAITGPHGIIFGFSLAVAAIQALTFAFADNKKEVEETTKKTRDLIDTYVELSKIKAIPAPRELDEAIKQIKKDIDETTKAIKEYSDKIKDLQKIPPQRYVLGIPEHRKAALAEAKQDKTITEERLAELKQQYDAFIKLSDTYSYLTQLANEFIKSNIGAQEVLRQTAHLSQNELNALIRYLEEQRNSVARNSKEYLRLTEIIDALSGKNKTKTKQEEVYIRAIQLGNQILKDKILTEEALNKIYGLNNNELSALIKLLDEERDKINKNTQAYKDLSKIIEELSLLQKEGIDYYKRYRELVGLAGQIRETGLTPELTTQIKGLTLAEYNLLLDILEKMKLSLPVGSKELEEIENRIAEIVKISEKAVEPLEQYDQRLVEIAKKLLDIGSDYEKTFKEVDLSIEEFQELQRILNVIGKDFKVGSEEAQRLYQVLSLFKGLGQWFDEQYEKGIIPTKEGFLAHVKAEKERKEEKEKEKAAKERLEIERAILRQYDLQVNALGEIADAYHRLTRNQKSALQTAIILLQTVLRIAETASRMKMPTDEGGVSQTTGTLQIIATIIRFIAAIAGFQRGGIVEGTSGRAVPIIAHAGEMVLNRQQQRNLFKLIATPSIGTMGLNVKVSGVIKAKKNEFIADLSRSEKIYKRYLAI